LSFGERNNLIRDIVCQYLPKDFPQAVQILVSALGPEIPRCELAGFDAFIVMSQNDFITKYGLDHFELAEDEKQKYSMDGYTCFPDISETGK